MDKPLVFISHITEERNLAILVKELIETSFLGMLDVFVSSDEHSISLGQRWLDSITGSLKNCNIEIVLCSPKSIDRPWINFEAGAGWIRDIPVIPLCHSGMEPAKLPLPLNLLQAAKVSEVSSMKLIFPVLAQSIGAKVPAIDFMDFINSAKNFEDNYSFWDECNERFKKLSEFNIQIIPVLKQGQIARMDLSDANVQFIQELMKFFTPQEILEFKQMGSSKFTANGIFHDMGIFPMSKFRNTVTDKRFKL